MKKQRVSIAQHLLTVEYPTINKKFTADLTKYPQSIYRQCDSADHGMKQKFGDAKSGESAQEKYDMVLRIHENLMKGSWELTATPDHSGIVIEAICRLKKVKEAEVCKAVEKNPEKISEWRSNTKVKLEIAKILVERAEKNAEDDTTEIDVKL